MRNGFIAAAVLLLAGCQPQPVPEATSPAPDAAQEERMLATDRRSYAPGDTVTLTLTNHFEHELGYNLCPSALDQRADDRWVPAPHQEDRVCTLELRLLPTGEAASFPFPLDRRMPPGEYRFRTTVEDMAAGTRTEHQSNVFVIS